MEILDVVHCQDGGENTAEILLFVFLCCVEMIDRNLKTHMTILAEAAEMKYYKEHFHALDCNTT